MRGWLKLIGCVLLAPLIAVGLSELNGTVGLLLAVPVGLGCGTLGMLWAMRDWGWI